MAIVTTSTWLPSSTVAATAITIPYAAINTPYAAPTCLIDQTEAADIRKVLFHLCQAMYEHQNALALADRPAKMVITKSASVDPATSQTTNFFQLQFITADLNPEVIGE